MKANQAGGSFARRHFEKVALVLSLVVLLVSTLLLVLRVNAHRRMLATGASLRPVSGIAATPLDISNQMLRVENLRNPIAVPQASQHMMVGELRVSCVKCAKPISFQAMTCPFCSEAQPGDGRDLDSDGDGIPDQKEREMGMNLADPGDAFADPDGDRFITLLEFQAGTGPTNAASFPPHHTMLRLVRLQVEVFRMRFVSVQRSADATVFQLNMRDLTRTYFKKLGEVIEGWTLESYDEADPEGPTLTLKSGDASKRLVRGKIVPEESKTALVISLLDTAKPLLQLKKGESFTFAGRTYKVVDISEARVVIRDHSTDSEEIILGPITAEDRRWLKGLSAGANAVPPGEMPPFRP